LAFELYDVAGTGEISAKNGLRLITEGLKYPLRKDEQRIYSALTKAGTLNLNMFLDFISPRFVSFKLIHYRNSSNLLKRLRWTFSQWT